MEYNEKLKLLRIKRKLTLEQIGDVLNTTKQYYQKYEKGIRPLPIDRLKTLCEYYQVSADYILGLPPGLNWPREEKKSRG